MNRTLSFAQVRSVESWTHGLRRLLAFSLIAVGLGASVSAQAQNVVNTLAGAAGVSGNVNATGAAARFSFAGASGIGVDTAGNLYVADTANNAVRKIVISSGAVTTFAGSLNAPRGIAVDGAGNVYVADTGSQTIRMITPGGAVTTLAGAAGSSGYTNATGAAARFSNPQGIAADRAGAGGAAVNLYVADSGNNAIRQIVVATQVVTTLAGSATGASGNTNDTGTLARFFQPVGIAVDATGPNVYVADEFNHLIRKIVVSSGVVTTLAGTGSPGYSDGSPGIFNNPSGVAVDGAGNVYVADSGTQTIRKITSGGVVSTLAGTGNSAGTADGLATTVARFNNPSSVAVDAAGVVYAVDSNNETVRKIALAVAPTIPVAPANQSVTAGQTATFTVAVAGTTNPAPTSYQWYRQPNGVVGFSILSNTSPYSGVTTATLTVATAVSAVNGTSPALNGDQFRCAVSNGVAPDATSSPASTLTVTQAPAITSANTAQFAVGVAGQTFQLLSTGSTPMTYGYTGTLPTFANLNTSTGVLTVSPVTADAAGSPYTFTFTASNGVAPVATQPFTLTVQTGAAITIQPVDHSIAVGQSTTFTVGVSGSPVPTSFQWQYQVSGSGYSNVNDSGYFTGSTTASLSVIGAPLAYSGFQFRCVVSNGVGTAVTSNAATLTVNQLPVFSSAASASFSTGTPGQTFIVVATGTPGPTYGYTGTLPTFANLNTSSGLLTVSPSSADAPGSPYSFNFTATNAAGTAVQPFVLTVINGAGITTQPANQTVAVGQTAVFTVVASGSPAPTSYQWQRQAYGTGYYVYLSDGGGYSGSATASLVVTGTTVAMSGDSFQCIIYNGVGAPAQTVPATLTVTQVPAFTSVNNASFNAGQTTSFTAVATGSPAPTYGYTGTLPPFANLNTSTGVLTASPAAGDVASSPYTFTLTATNIAGAATQSFTLTVLPPLSVPVFTTQPISQTIPLGQNATYTVVVAGNPVPTYQWQRAISGSGWYILADDTTYSGSATATLTVAGVTTAMSGDQFQCVATNSNGSVGSTAASLTVSLGSTFTTIAGLAGSTGVGSVDGTGSAARFSGPFGAAVDSAGNINVADSSNHTIRKVTAAGVVTTVAGVAGSRGSADGTIDVARFNSPSGVAVDAAGNIYVADTGNNTIRKISSSSGILYVSTVAGTANASGSTDATGAAARFTYPNGIAIDTSGNLYVADTQNSTIRMITPAGVVSTVAGLAGSYGSTNGTGAAARFRYPYGVAVDSTGTLYVADSLNHTIRKIAGGVVTTFAGSGVSGSLDATGILAQFNQPSALTVDSTGNVYVADTYNSTVRKITPAGVVSTLAGLAGTPGSANGTGSTVRFNRPFGVAVDSSGNVFVADTGNNTIRANGIGAVSAPQIQTQPANQITSVGQSAVFTIAAVGSPMPNYQWQRQASGTSTFVNLTDDLTTYSGSATATLMVNVTSLAMNGDQFQCMVSNGVSPSAVSTAALLSLNMAPAFTTAPLSQTALVGGAVTMTVVATGSPAPTYQWRKGGAAISGATSTTLTLGNVQLVDAGDYDVVATNQFGSATSSLAQLAVVTTSSVPVITMQPANQTVVAGGSVTLNALAVAFPAVAYQWRLNGAFIVGATNATLTLANVPAASAGQYDVLITNALGSVLTQAVTLRVIGHSFAGTYFGSYGPGLGSYALYIRADNTGVGLFSKLPGATNAFVSYNIAVDDAGGFSVTSTSASADRPVAADQLGVGSSEPVAAATTNVISGTIGINGSVTGTISGVAGALLSGTRASDTGATQAVAGYYQAGAALSSATTLAIVSAAGQAFVLTRTATTADAGLGTVNSSGQISVATTGQGIVTGTVTAATSQLTATAINSLGQATTFAGGSEAVLATQRLSSISTRARVGAGDSVVIAGFIITGQESKSVMIRAVGPTLANFGVSSTVAAPKLDLYRVGTSAPIATNTGWATSGNTAAITAAAVRSGAFALGASSADSVILTTLAPGSYTAIMSGANNTAGVGLVEVYDLSTPLVGQKMIDISTRAAVGTGDNVLIAGVYVSGSVSKRVLIRAIGPGLAPYLSGALALPQLALFRGTQTTPVLQNAGWSVSPDASAISAASAQVAGLALTTADAALIVSLDPGVAYTAQVTGVNGSAGIALVEIYELP